MSILGFILMLILVLACVWIAEYLVPGRVPGGLIASASVGLLGAYLGSRMMGQIGPHLAGLSVFPTVMGSALLVFFLVLVGGGLRGKNFLES